MILWYTLNGYIFQIFIEYILEIFNLTNCINTCNILGSFQGIQHQSLTHQFSILVSPHLCLLDLYFCLHALMRSQHLDLVTSSSKFIYSSWPHHLCSVLVRTWCVRDKRSHVTILVLQFCYNNHSCYDSCNECYSI